jgi:hypothetical protein
MSSKFSNWTYIGHKFKYDSDLLQRVRDAKQLIEPEHERKVRTIQLDIHKAKCHNHSS